MKIAKRKSKRVELAITKMKDEGVLWKETTWGAIRKSEDMYVYLLNNDDAVWGLFPDQNSIIHGNVSLSAKCVPYLFLVNKVCPIKGDVLISKPSGAVYYIFQDESLDGEDLDGYIAEYGEWEVSEPNMCHCETVWESGL